MANFANQRTIEVTNQLIDKVAHKSNDNENKFLRAIDWYAISAAQQVLSGNEIDLLIYLIKWAGQGYCDFSPAAVEVETTMSESTAQRALTTLIDFGYVKKKEGYDKRYEIDLYPEGIEERAKLKKAERILAREARGKKIIGLYPN